MKSVFGCNDVYTGDIQSILTKLI